MTRCKAVAQLEAGKNQSEVARGIGVSIRTVKRWWKKHQTGQELTKTPGRGRKPKLLKAAKITISKSLTKSAQSICQLAARLTSKGHKVSHETVRKHMLQSLKVLPFKPQLQSQLTVVQQANRVKFCRERKSLALTSGEGCSSQMSPRLSCSNRQIVKTIESGLVTKKKFPPPSQSSIH